MHFFRFILLSLMMTAAHLMTAQNLLYQVSDIKNVDDGRSHLAQGYFHILEDMAIFNAHARGVNFYIYGKVEEFERVMKGDQIIETTFFIRGREESTGSLVSFEMKEWPDGEVRINFFKKLDGLDVLFTGHKLPTEEINTLIRE